MTFIRSHLASGRPITATKVTLNDDDGHMYIYIYMPMPNTGAGHFDSPSLSTLRNVVTDIKNEVHTIYAS